RPPPPGGAGAPPGEPGAGRLGPIRREPRPGRGGPAPLHPTRRDGGCRPVAQPSLPGAVSRVAARRGREALRRGRSTLPAGGQLDRGRARLEHPRRLPPAPRPDPRGPGHVRPGARHRRPRDRRRPLEQGALPAQPGEFGRRARAPARGRGRPAQAIAILRDAGNELSLMRGLNALSVVLQKRGALGEAGALADEATRLARQVGSPRELANLLWLQGGLATIRGETGRARDWYDQAERQLAEVREEGLLAVFVADRKQLAEPSVRTCRDLESSERELERLGDRAATEITVDVSRCWSEAGSPRDAKRWLDLAEKTATASQLPEDRIELDLARAAVALGAHRWPEAERTLAAAASQCRNDSLGTLLMETRLLQTRLSLARGDHPERVRTLAEELREDALAGSFGKVAREVDEILRAPRLARPALTPTLSQPPAPPPGEGATSRAAREPTHP